MHDRSAQVFYAATKIVATQCHPERTHQSPDLVAKAVDLAELLVAECERRERAAEDAAAKAAAPTPPAP